MMNFRRQTALALLFMFLMLSFIGCKTASPLTDQPLDLQINILDVGQGDSIYITLPNGETMLIDAGEKQNSQDIIDYIRTDGKNSLTYVVATHPHADHIGGMADLLNAIEVKNIYMPKAFASTRTFETLLDTVEQQGLSIQTAKAGKTIFDFGNIKAEFIAPNQDDYESLNNYSAVILLTYNEKRFLFMGDAEKESEAEILANGYHISADVLKVGHHGSTTSSTKSFINAVNPTYAVICVGEDNNYGHPASATLSVLKNAEIWRTDEKGTIIITCDGEKITIRTMGL